MNDRKTVRSYDGQSLIRAFGRGAMESIDGDVEVVIELHPNVASVLAVLDMSGEFVAKVTSVNAERLPNDDQLARAGARIDALNEQISALIAERSAAEAIVRRLRRVKS